MFFSLLRFQVLLEISGLFFRFFLTPFKPAAKVRSNRGQMAGMPFEGQSRLERVWPDRDLAVLLTR
jgi:hypothetical protein